MEKGITIHEKIRKAEWFAKMISRIPQDKEAQLVSVLNAYADGLLAGRISKKERESTLLCKRTQIG